MKIAIQNTNVMNTLKLHLGMGLTGENEEDNILDIQVKIAEIDAEFKRMLDCVSAETIEAFDDEKATRLMNEKANCNSSSPIMTVCNSKEKIQNQDLTTYVQYLTD